jgi:hypothetical protein
VYALTHEEGQAISDCARGLPAAASFKGHEADWREGGGDWGRHNLPPEAIAEDIVLDRARIARKLGFPSPVNPEGVKKRLANGRYPDLWCAEGVVGEVKNQVTARWGPDQIEDYIAQCDRQWPHYRWRGILVQGQPEMAPNARPRLSASGYRRRLEVWTVYEDEERRGRLTVRRLYP